MFVIQLFITEENSDNLLVFFVRSLKTEEEVLCSVLVRADDPKMTGSMRLFCTILNGNKGIEMKRQQGS